MKDKNGKEILARFVPAVKRYRCNYCGEDHTRAGGAVEHMALIHRWACHYNTAEDVIVRD